MPIRDLFNRLRKLAYFPKHFCHSKAFRYYFKGKIEQKWTETLIRWQFNMRLDSAYCMNDSAKEGLEAFLKLYFHESVASGWFTTTAFVENVPNFSSFIVYLAKKYVPNWHYSSVNFLHTLKAKASYFCIQMWEYFWSCFHFRF